MQKIMDLDEWKSLGLTLESWHRIKKIERVRLSAWNYYKTPTYFDILECSDVVYHVLGRFENEESAKLALTKLILYGARYE